MLYILNPSDNISPFDVSMATDAGFDHIIPFPHVQPENVTAMVGPFQVGVFANPNGAYTTSASVLALVQKALEDTHETSIKDKTIAIFGIGPVGLCTAVFASVSASALTSSEKIAALNKVNVVICVAKAGIRILEQKELNAVDNLLVVADTNPAPPSGVDGIGMQDQSSSISQKHTSSLYL